MKAKDQKIIDGNQGKTPQELLGLGLSPEGYGELIGQMNGVAQKTLQAERIPHISPNVLKPQVQQYNQASSGRSGKVRLVPASGGVGTLMSRSQAESTSRRHPGMYKIID